MQREADLGGEILKCQQALGVGAQQLLDVLVARPLGALHRPRRTAGGDDE